MRNVTSSWKHSNEPRNELVSLLNLLNEAHVSLRLDTYRRRQLCLDLGNAVHACLYLWVLLAAFQHLTQRKVTLEGVLRPPSFYWEQA